MYFHRFEGAGVMRRFLCCTRENISLICNGVESHCKGNGVLVHLSTKYSLMELKNGTSIG